MILVYEMNHSIIIGKPRASGDDPDYGIISAPDTL